MNQKTNFIVAAAGVVFVILSVLVVILLWQGRQSSAISITATEDPCAAQNISGEVRKVYDRMHKFDDISFVANLTPQDQLAAPVLKMQDVRYELEYVDVAECVAPLKQAAINYMNSVIIYLAHFMGGVDRQQVNLEITAADELRNLYDGELERLTGADLIQPTFTPIPPK
jgi:hypothetical protein